MEYYLTIKRKQPFIQTTARVELKGIMLSEESQAQKVTYGVIPFVRHSRHEKVIEMGEDL